MPWAALDDGFHDDPRTLKAGLTAAGLYACALSYVARYLLDGVIPRQALLRMLEGGDMAPLDALLDVGYVVETDDGYYLPDYLKPGGNVPREKVEQRRKDAADRKQRWADKQATKKRTPKDENT